MICHSFISICEQDNPTIRKAIFIKAMLHNFVVAMSVYSDIVDFAPAKIHNFIECAMAAWRACNSVNYDVWFSVVKPLSVVYYLICRVGAWYCGEICSRVAIVVVAQEAIAGVYVGGNNIFVWIIAGPLLHIAIAAHNFFCA